ncbi:hypothetical protein [Paenibacillus oleatilyticus]|uniref:Uncharacterized protein n=1 Tax=Paenibacillus oleatilyticus TaxID=2594886 RepID=A0ABV4VCZ6_9BACL
MQYYIYPTVAQYDQFGQLTGYYPQYLVRAYPFYPAYYLWNHHECHGGWGHEVSPEQWHNGYSGTIITDDIDTSEIERLPSFHPPTIHPPTIHPPTIHPPTIHPPTIHPPTIHPPTIHPPIPCGFTGYKTNKFDHERNVEKGGWVAAWADDIAEKDVLQGVVAAGVSVVSADPAPFLLWIKDLVNRTISSLKASAQQVFTREIRNQIEKLAADVIKQAIQGRSAREVVKTFENLRFDIKAGAIKYTGGNYVCGNLVPPHTWGMKPYIAIRIRHI